jgi:DNA-binding transcriptional LysR family regulator
MVIGNAYSDAMLRDVEIRQLRALQAVAEEGSFGKAAERLGFTQSAISQQIAGLERAVGDKVFDRQGGPRRAELTPTGSVLLGYAHAMLAQLQLAEDGLRSLRAGDVGRLVVGSFQSVSVNILPAVVGRLRSERPGLMVRAFEDDGNDELERMLLSDELDLSFLVGMPDDPAIEAWPLLVDPFVLVSAASAPPLSCHPSALHGLPMIGQPNCSCQGAIDESLREYDVEPDYVFRSADNGAVQAMVRAGMGSAVMPLLAVDMNDRGVVVSALNPPLTPRTVVLAKRRSRTLIPAADRFLELARAVCDALQLSDTLAASSN